MPRNTRRSVSRNAATSRWPVDHRDQIVGATLVGIVLVLLGYASGIGGGSGVAQASGGAAPGTLAVAPSPSVGGSPPAIIQAIGSGDGGVPGGYGYGSGGEYGSGQTSASGSGSGPSGISGASPPAPASASATPSAGSPSPVIVGVSTSATPSPASSGTVSPTASCGLLGCVTSALTGTSGLLPCLLGPGIPGLLPTGPTGPTGLLPGVTTVVGPLTGELLGSCPTATPTPSAS